MKTIRIFISSPGDVAEERERARQVVEQLRRRYAGQFDLKAVLWEDLPLQADTSFQQGIDAVLSRERGLDIAIFILWSRLGSPLGSVIRKADGSAYRSGTEREFDLMLAARRQSGTDAPRIIVYTRRDEASFDERLRGKPTDEKNSLISQKKLLETFIEEEFHDAASGTNIRAYHSFDQPVTFSQRLREHLQEMLDALAGGFAGEPVWDIAKRGSPFRGLESFEFAHNPVFFGREDEVLEVRRALQRKAREGCAFVLISGASGSGKSSLARAGVLPAVVEYEVDSTVIGWRYAVCTPSQFAGDLCGGLARLLCAESVLPELRIGADSLTVLAEGLALAPKLTVDQSIRPALARASQGKPGTVRLLLLVDQLEELFTDKRLTDAARDRFVELLEALARSGGVWVLATARSDFYQHCQRLPALMRMKEGPGQVDLLPPSADALHRLIDHPARLAGLRFEQRDGASLAGRILTDATAHAELLPLVSYVLRELFEQRTPAGLLTFAAYEQLGGVEGALAKRAETAFASLSPAAQSELSPVLRALVSVSGDEEESVVRQRVPLTAFLPDSPARALVDRFVAERFLVTEKGADDSATVAVAHEALLRVWSRAAQWIADNREFLRVRARVAARMKEGSRLLDGDPLLEAARHHLANTPGGFSADQATFIGDCVHAVQQARTRRERLRRTVMAVLISMLVLALGAAGWAGYKQREATRARDRAIIAEQAAETRRREADHLKNEQSRIAKETQLREARITWLPRAQKATAERQFPQNVFYAARALGFKRYGFESLTPEQQKIISGKFPALFDPKDQPELYDNFRQLMEGEVKPLLPIWSSPIIEHHGDSVTCVAFSPDGKVLATGSADKTIRLWDVATGQVRAILHGHGGGVFGVSFSSDSETLASGSADNTIKIWKVATGQELTTLRGHKNTITSVAFSPDGKILASGSDDETIKVWNVANGETYTTLSGYTASVWGVAFSADGKTLASGSAQGQIRLWDTATWQERITLRHGVFLIRSVAFSPDGRIFASGSSDRTIKLWDTATWQERTTLRGHSGTITSVAFNPDGKVLASGSFDNTIKLWDTTTGQERTTLRGHGGVVASVSFSLDGKTLISGSVDKTVRVWNLATKEERAPMRGHSNIVKSVSFSPDGKIFASGSSDHTIKLWNAATGQEYATLRGHSGAVTSVRFSPDGRTLASGSYDRTIKLWDTTAGQERTTLRGHSGYVSSVSFSPDGASLVSGSADTTIKLWDIATGQERATLRGHSEVVTSVLFSPDGRTLASVSLDNTAVTWDVDTKQKRTTSSGDSGGLTSVTFSPDGKTLAGGSSDKTIKVWNAATGKTRTTLRGHGDTVKSVAFNPVGTSLASASDDNTIKLWDTATWTVVATLIDNGGTFESVAFSPDGRTLASGSADKTIKLWDVTGQEIDTWRGHEDTVNSVAVSPDGRILASGADDTTIKLWDVAIGQEMVTCRGHEDSVTSVAFGPDGKTLASGSLDNTIKVWNVPSGQELATWRGHTKSVTSVAFSADGTTLASGSADKTIKLWVVADGRESATLRGHEDSVTSVAFSLDGKILASGSADDTIKLWVVANGRENATLRGHEGSVTSVAFSPDGKILASGSADDTIKLWVVANGRESATLRGHKDSITSVAFSPDGKILASGSDDKTIRIWDVETGQTICMLRRHEDAITSVAFFPDGRTLASGSDDDSIILWGVVKPTLNLAAYFLGGWYTANETTGENHPSFGLQENLYRQRTYGFLNMSRGTHLSILQSARSPEEANRFLFEHYIRQKAWSGAFALLEQPMDRPIATRLRYTTGINFNISRGEYVGAVEYATRLANHLRELVSREEAAKSQLADALSELAWYQEMCGQFPEALKSAEEAVVLNREDVPSLLQASYAHALLFTGQYAKAATIYQKHKDKKYTFWRNWNDEVLNQLTLLRERGYSHADMTKIEALLRSKQK